MLMQKIDRCEIVSCACQIQNGLDANLIHLKVCMIRNLAPDNSQDQLIALKEVNQIAQALDNDKIRLHPDDVISTEVMMT